MRRKLAKRERRQVATDKANTKAAVRRWNIEKNKPKRVKA